MIRMFIFINILLMCANLSLSVRLRYDTIHIRKNEIAQGENLFWR